MGSTLFACVANFKTPAKIIGIRAAVPLKVKIAALIGRIRVFEDKNFSKKFNALPGIFDNRKSNQ